MQHLCIWATSHVKRHIESGPRYRSTGPCNTETAADERLGSALLWLWDPLMTCVVPRIITDKRWTHSIFRSGLCDHHRSFFSSGLFTHLGACNICWLFQLTSLPALLGIQCERENDQFIFCYVQEICKFGDSKIIYTDFFNFGHVEDILM